MTTTVDVQEDVIKVEVLQEVFNDTEVFLEVSVATTVTERVEVLVEGGQGPAGRSVYQIAVDNGFAGTEQEWLETQGGQPVYRGKTLVRGGGGLTEVRLYEDAEKTVLAKILHLVKAAGVVVAVEVRDAGGSLVQTKTLQRNAQGVLVGVTYA